MREEKKVVTLDPVEQGVVIVALNDMRNDKLKEHKSTDDVDDVLMKVLDAPSRKVRMPERDEAR